jgi:hypothetical protein
MSIQGRSRFWSKEEIRSNRQDPFGAPIRMFSLSLKLSEEDRKSKIALELSAKKLQRRNAGLNSAAIVYPGNLFDISEFKEDKVKIELPEKSFDTTKLDMVSVNQIIKELTNEEFKDNIVDLRRSDSKSINRKYNYTIF